MTAIARGEGDRTLVVVDRTSRLLLGLLGEGPERIFFSNQSLRDLITPYRTRLLRVIGDRREDEVLTLWEKELPAFQRRLERLAREGEQLRRGEMTVAAMFEGKVGKLLRDCGSKPDGPDYSGI